MGSLQAWIMCQPTLCALEAALTIGSADLTNDYADISPPSHPIWRVGPRFVPATMPDSDSARLRRKGLVAQADARHRFLFQSVLGEARRPTRWQVLYHTVCDPTRPVARKPGRRAISCGPDAHSALIPGATCGIVHGESGRAPIVGPPSLELTLNSSRGFSLVDVADPCTAAEVGRPHPPPRCEERARAGTAPGPDRRCILVEYCLWQN